ncbi:MAG TPA: zinc-ribbon domain-containing protein [Anaerolineales bacterium]|jgi:rubrerythrin
MDIGAIFLLLSVGLLTGLFVARPFMERRRSSNGGQDDPALSSLLAERDRLIGALQELDFDHALGKIPAQDYPGMRMNLLQHASDVLRKLDILQPQLAVHSDAESRVEAVIAARRADAAEVNTKKEVAISDEDLEELVAARRTARKDKSVGFCPKCGKPVLRSDRFCPSCGKPIA